MNFLASGFRILICLAVALPLGPGGLCCCIVGTGDAHAAAVQADVVTRSCCTVPEPTAPAPSSSGSNASDQDDCDCPVRDDAVLVSGTADVTLASVATDTNVFNPATSWSVATASDAEVRFATEVPSPVPKQPRYQALCVFRC